MPQTVEWCPVEAAIRLPGAKIAISITPHNFR